MFPKSRLMAVLLVASSFLAFALPAAADVTLVSRYTLTNGDTLTRASYFTSKRSRVTAPDGRELMFESQYDRLTVIDHRRKIYWMGPLAQADSIADRILMEGRREIAKVAEADQAAWIEKVQAFNESVHLEQTEQVRKIAGYPSTKWVLTAGDYLQHERWVARSLSVANYGPEVQKAAMAMAADPLGRLLLKLLVGMRDIDGLPLAAKTTFRTLTQSGSFGFETLQVIGKTIPASAWEIPKDYKRIQL